MSGTLIVYASNHGQTARIASRMAGVLREDGGAVELREVGEAAGLSPSGEYDCFTRTLMRLIMRREGHPTDTSRDYDYTDWDAVDRFARECAATLVRGSGTPS